MLWQFLLCSKVNQIYGYIFPSCLDFLPIQSTEQHSLCHTVYIIIFTQYQQCVYVYTHTHTHTHTHTYVSVPVSQFFPPPFLFGTHMFVLCVSISALQIRSSILFVQIPQICVNIRLHSCFQNLSKIYFRQKNNIKAKNKIRC